MFVDLKAMIGSKGLRLYIMRLVIFVCTASTIAKYALETLEVTTTNNVYGKTLRLQILSTGAAATTKGLKGIIKYAVFSHLFDFMAQPSLFDSDLYEGWNATDAPGLALFTFMKLVCTARLKPWTLG